jgi:hypothetical protein
MDFEQALDVGKVALTSGDGLVHDEIFRGRGRDAPSSHRYRLGAIECCAFERQPSEAEVDVGSRIAVSEQDHLIAPSELQSVRNRGEIPWASRRGRSRSRSTPSAQSVASMSSVRRRTPRAITATPPISMCRPAPASARSRAAVAETKGVSAKPGRSSQSPPREVEREVLFFTARGIERGSQAVGESAELFHPLESVG